MKTKNILIGAFAICFVFVSLASCKNKKQTADSAPVAEQAPPPPPAAPNPPPAVDNIPPAPPKEEGIALEYRRTACFGTCPIFNFKVYDNGRAIYEGKNFVDMIGVYHTNISKNDIDKIVDAAEKIKFFQMDDVYDSQVTDLPSVYLSILKDGKFKTVKNRHNGPKELKALYEQVDALIKAQKWEMVDQSPRD